MVTVPKSEQSTQNTKRIPINVRYHEGDSVSAALVPRLTSLVSGRKEQIGDTTAIRRYATMRLPRFSKVECTGFEEPQPFFGKHSATIDKSFAPARSSPKPWI